MGLFKNFGRKNFWHGSQTSHISQVLVPSKLHSVSQPFPPPPIVGVEEFKWRKTTKVEAQDI